MTFTSDDIAGSARVLLGHSNLVVRPVGLGCMGMSQFYGEADDAQSAGTIREALDLGVDFIDTSDIHGAANMLVGAENRGFGHNEQLIGGAIAGAATRWCWPPNSRVRLTDDGKSVRIDGHPDYVVSACEASLRRLGVEVIDLYYAHRLDPNVPVEDTVGAMARLGRSGHGALHRPQRSNRGPCYARPMGLTPSAALQSEYSLVGAWRRGEILPTCRELGHHLRAVQPARAIHADRRGQRQDALRHRRFPDHRSALPAENLPPTLPPSRRSRHWPRASSAVPASSRSPGSWPSPSTSCRSPAPSASNTCARTSPRPTSPLAATRLPISVSIFAPDRIAGERYAPNDPGRRRD